MMFILLLARDNIYTDKRNQSLAQRQMVFLRQLELPHYIHWHCFLSDNWANRGIYFWAHFGY